MYNKIDMYVYSGTGNTLKAAQCIGEAGKAKDVDYEINMIDVNSRPKEHKPDENHLMGLMAPTIGAIQPISFFSFILRLPKGNGQNVFLAGTGAWTKIGPVFVPGYVGFGLYLAALLLIVKGYRVVGITGFGMPVNWTTLIPPYRKKLETRINKEIHATAANFSLDILSGKRIFKRIGDLVFTLIIFPLPFLFILFGHIFLAKIMFAGANCNGCGLCAANCPRKAIKMYGKKRRRPYWTYKCEQCMRCAGYCPRKAVESNTFIAATFILVFFIFHMDTLILGLLEPVLDNFFISKKILMIYLLNYALFLLISAAIYGLFYLFNKVTIFSKIFTVLSFTHYWRKYRQTDIKAGEICRQRRRISRAR